MSSFRKSLLTFGATAALTGAFAINGTVNAEAAEWEARTVEEVENDIQTNGLEAKYTIQWGDTLGTISKALDISVDQITDMNEIANRDLIIAGNTLHLSSDSDTVSVEDNVTHEVETFELEEKEVTEPVETSSEESEETPVEAAAAAEAPTEETVEDSVVEDALEVSAEEPEETPVEEVEAPEVSVEEVEAPVEETTTESTPAPAQQASNGSEHNAKEWIAQRESNGSYTAYNSAGGYYGRYQLNPSLINYGASPEEQEAAADNYVAGRYGSWSEAKAFWEANGWY